VAELAGLEAEEVVAWFNVKLTMKFLFAIIDINPNYKKQQSQFQQVHSWQQKASTIGPQSSQQGVTNA